MINTNLTDVQMASALAEQIYRRSQDGSHNLNDHGITLKDLNANSVSLEIQGLQPDTDISDGAHPDTYYYSAQGFVGHLVVKDGTLWVVFRGTDSAESFLAGGLKAGIPWAVDDFEAQDSSHQSDLGDWITNKNLASGTLGRSQLDDAMSLTNAAIAYAAANNLTVKVAGQSLGGGLAGIVSAITGLETYAIAPAPFSNQVAVELTLKALASFGISKADVLSWGESVTVVQIGDGGTYTSTNVEIVDAFSTGSFLLEVLEGRSANGETLTAAQISSILSLRQSYLNSAYSNLHVHTIEGEILSDGFAGTISEIMEGAVQFSTERTSYDVGADYSSLSAGNTVVSLHGASLHNLVIRTHGMGPQSFENLLLGDPSIRYAFLENQAISGPISGTRADPVDMAGAPVYGGSGVGSEGASTAILYRALWKTVGEPDGFYSKFVTNFGGRIAVGAVGEGWSSLAYDISLIHVGFVYLGLEVVRDAILRDGTGIVAPQGLSVFDDVNGGLLLDKANITGQDFGTEQLNEAFRILVTEADLDYGIPEIVDSSLPMLWSVAVTQKGLSPLLYGMAVDGSLDGVPGNKAAIVFGWDTDDRILGSSQKDYIWGGKGDDIIEGGAGADLLIGGEQGLSGDTVSYSSSTSGVNIRLSALSQSGGDAEGDALAGFENVIGSEHTDTLRGDNGVNRLEGRGGSDFFYVEGSGSAANGDTFDGGDGADWVVLADANDLGAISGLGDGSFRYSVDLGSGYVQGGSGPGIWAHLESIENVTGSAYWDKIVGSAADNVILGGAGNDVIVGGGGNDTITGGGDRDPFDTEVDTVCFSGTWGNYQFTIDPDGYECIVVEDMAQGDGTDTIFGVEMFQFADVTLRWDEIANKAPTSIVFAEGQSQIFEDALGNAPVKRLVATLNTVDPNNVNSDSAFIDRHSYTMAPASSPYYGITSSGMVYKQAENYVNYETWRPMMQSLHASLIGSAMSFEDWLEDIKDGISSVNHAAVIAQLADMYKFTVMSTDLHGASLTQSFIVSYGNVSGTFTGTEGNDTLSGTNEEDYFYGLGGNDMFLGSYGPDTFFGGAGVDTVSYAITSMTPYQPQGVIVNLATGGTSGDAAGDVYNSVENVIGSWLNDTLTGDGADNQLTGGKGNDTISGGGGIDTAVFYGTWSQYRFTRTMVGSSAGYSVLDTISGRDGTDKVDGTVEFYRFYNGTLTASELFNKAPVAAVAMNTLMKEDEFGQPADEKLVGILSVTDANNSNSTGSMIDPLSFGIAAESLPYYALVGDEIRKIAGFELDYEAWYANLKSAWSTVFQNQGVFEDWLDSIKTSGISASKHSEIVALIDSKFKIGIDFSDSFASYKTTFIVYVNDIEGHVVGDSGDNMLSGANEDDVIEGLGGNDILEGLLGPDILDGGDGNDTASYAHATSAVSINLKTGAASGAHAAGDSFISIENLEGSAYADTLTGDDGDNVITPGDGKDTSDGGAGIDTLDYSKFNKQVTIDLQSSEVREYGTSYVEKAYNFENATGTNYNDTCSGTAGNNVFKGLGGNDTFYGRGGSDVFDGGDGTDLVSWNYTGASFIEVNFITNVHGGDASDDILIDIEGIEGTAGNDTMIAGDKRVIFRGLDGDDHLYGGAGGGSLDGGSGDDHIYPGLGADFIQDWDLVTIDYSAATTGIQILWNNYNDRFEGRGSIAEGDQFYDAWLGYMTLIGSDFDDVLMGRPHRNGTILFNSIFGDETIYGGAGNDTIKVQTGNNIAYGGTGNDVISAEPLYGPLNGSAGINHLYGEEGDDTITGGAAADFLYGGSGWDWIDPGTDAEVDLVDFGEDGGGLKFTAKGTVPNGYGINVDLSTMTISENRLGSAPVANLWSNDTIVGEVTGVWGTALNDLITGSDKSEKFLSAGGYDVILAEGGDDYIKIDGSGVFWGGAGEDFIEVNSGSATIYGGEGNDLIYGGRDSDFLFGDDGDDIIYAYNPVFGMASETYQDVNHLYGGAGADKMYGGNGKDYFHSLDDGDFISGYGSDIVLFDEADHGIAFSQSTGFTSNGTKLSGYTELHGTNQADDFTMSGGVVVYGEGGNDVFRGKGTFYGGAGDDVVFAAMTNTEGMAFFGGAGDDVLWGSNGYDGFHMDGGDDIYVSTRDHVKNYLWDFDAGQGSADKIVLDISYLYKNGSLMSVSDFIATKTGYDGYNHYTSLNLGDTTILLYGGDYRGTLHADDFIFV